MLSDIEIKARIQDLLDQKLSIAAFEDWLVPTSWNMHLWASPSVQRLVSALELRLAELGRGHLRENEFRRELQEMLVKIPAAGWYSADVYFAGGGISIFYVSTRAEAPLASASSNNSDPTLVDDQGLCVPSQDVCRTVS